VEHDRETILSADQVIDMGPGAGALGGRVVESGAPEHILRSERSLTGRYLRGELSVAPEREPRPPLRAEGDRMDALRLRGIRHHNLKGIEAEIPFGLLTVVSGVSGSGKSSLVVDALGGALRRALAAAERPGGGPAGRGPGRPPKRRPAARRQKPSRRVEELEGAEKVKRLVLINQSPIGQSPRSNPATYTGLWNEVRALYALLPEARVRGYGPERFSFNLPGGRCEACGGEGAIRVEMHFLSDVWIPCEECHGNRFNRGTLEIQFKGLHVGQILELEAERARELFADHPRVRSVLDVLCDVGLGYLKLGQSATTLSGGEAQRVKLASELITRAGGGTFYILDEPTTGLHFDDVRKLLLVLHRLVDAGNTMVVIEHNLDVLRSADWVIDLGPEGGEGGGRIVAAGRPEEIARVPESHTGRHLARILDRRDGSGDA
jgi:excinuclease ABC subunit A